MASVGLILQAPRVPEHLDLCLAGLYGQSYQDFEVLVTDARADDRHAEVLEHHAKHLKQKVRHIHAPLSQGESPNLGRALNAAVLSTDSEYLIFLGGACVLPPGFIEGHLAVADYGYFAHAETLPLDAPLSRSMDAVALGSGLAFDEAWIESVSPDWHARHLRGSALGMFRQWLQKDTPGLQYWNCETSSCFRDDLLAVDGFDMDVDDWRLDRDLANRLQNNGLEPVPVGVHGNVMRLLDTEARPEEGRGGRVPASLEPGGEVRAAAGLSQLARKAGQSRAA